MKKTMPVIMRSVFCISIIAAMIFALCSCGESAYIPDAYSKKPVQNLGVNYMIDMPTKIIFHSNDAGLLSYYSKADKKSYIYKFDPLTSQDDEMLQLIFGNTMNDEYCNGRLYAAYESSIYSVTPECTDMKKVYTSSYTAYGEILFENLGHYNQYLYFLELKGEDGYDLCRLDTNNNKAENLTENTGFKVRLYFFGDDCIYFMKAADTSLYRANLTLGDDKELPGVSSGIFDGTYTYGVVREKDGDKTVYKGIFKDNLEMLTREIIYENQSDLAITMRYVNDDYVYFVKGEKTVVGSCDGYECSNYSGGKLWRIDKNGENIQCVLDDINYDMVALNMFEGEMFALVTEYDTSNTERVKEKQYMARLSIDASGNITGIEKLNVTR